MPASEVKIDVFKAGKIWVWRLIDSQRKVIKTGKASTKYDAQTDAYDWRNRIYERLSY